MYKLKDMVCATIVNNMEKEMFDAIDRGEDVEDRKLEIMHVEAIFGGYEEHFDRWVAEYRKENNGKS